MKIAYFSPFSPIPSGIADFSEELILELKKYVDIDIFCKNNPENSEINSNFNVFHFEEIEKAEIRNQYDHLVYQLGNNISHHKEIADLALKYPGIVEFHDFSLHHFLANDTFVKKDYEKYIEIMKYCHGIKGEQVARDFLGGKIRAPWDSSPLEFTVNKHYIDNATAVIVHSDMAKQMVKGIRPNVRIVNIPLHIPDIDFNYEVSKKKARHILNIPEKINIFGSFGYATSGKRILQILDALSLYKNRNLNFHYFIVGKVENINIEEKIEALNLKNHVTVTGFTDLETFKNYMMACDFCFNLRYPTQGESSASLHRMLGMGKPAIVSSVGSFEEYPDDIVLKVRCDQNEVNDILSAIIELTENRKQLDIRSKKAVNYAFENCNLEMNAMKYKKFFEQIKGNCWQEEWVDQLVDKIFLLHLVDETYIRQFVEKISKLL